MRWCFVFKRSSLSLLIFKPRLIMDFDIRMDFQYKNSINIYEHLSLVTLSSVLPVSKPFEQPYIHSRSPINLSTPVRYTMVFLGLLPHYVSKILQMYLPDSEWKMYFLLVYLRILRKNTRFVEGILSILL